MHAQTDQPIADSLLILPLDGVCSKNGALTDEDLAIEWSFIQQQTKKSSIPIAAAYDMTLLREAQRELGM